MAAKANALGDFLRARRDQVRPEEVGLVLVGGAARLVCAARSWRCWQASAPSTTCDSSGDAPTSVPSDAGRARAGSAAGQQSHAVPTRLGRPERLGHFRAGSAAHGLAELIDQFLVPAIVANRYQDVLAANPIARALSPEFTPGQNFLRWRLLDPAARQLYVDWDEATEVAVSGFRELCGAVRMILACGR